MKNFILFFLLSFLQATDAPIGTWEYKQDKSRMEIQIKNGQLSGILLSTQYPHRKAGTEILKNMEYKKGKWRGNFYIYKTNRWVEITFEIKGELLFMEYTYGIQTTSLHFYRVESKNRKF